MSTPSAARPSLECNAGWHAWNMSKRLRDWRRYATEAPGLVEAARLAPEKLTQAQTMVAELQRAATRAEETWSWIRQVIDASDPTLADPPVERVTVLHRDADRRLAAE